MATMATSLSARILARNAKFSPRYLSLRPISTSKKNRETATISDVLEKSEAKAEVKVKKNWVTYGFDFHSEKEDRFFLHTTMFGAVTLVLVFGTFYLSYYPDWGMNDWYQREAFLELRRREAAGLPLIDGNLVEPSKITLPSDEELGNTEIVI